MADESLGLVAGFDPLDDEDEIEPTSEIGDCRDHGAGRLARSELANEAGVDLGVSRTTSADRFGQPIDSPGFGPQEPRCAADGREN